MPWPEEGTNPFPPAHRHEPASLRADILDELADHLALLAEREMANDGLPRERAWARAVERFGNPDALARRLWRDAMKEIIMREWIQTGVSVVSVLLMAAIALFVVVNLRAMQVTQLKMVEAMQSFENGARAPEGESLEVRVCRGRADGPPVPGVEVKLTGKLDAGEEATVNMKTDAAGVARFAPLPQGKYSLVLEDPVSEMHLIEQHSLFAGVGAKLDVVAPEITPVPVQFQLDAEIPFPNETVLLLTGFTGSYEIGGFSWNWGRRVFLGNKGIYEPQCHDDCRERESDRNNNWRYTYQLLGAPVASVAAPPVKLYVSSMEPVLHAADGSVGMVTSFQENRENASQEIAVSASGENRASVVFGDVEMALARKLLMNFTAQKWLWQRDMNLKPQVNGYVVDTMSLDQVIGVNVEDTGSDMATFTVVDSPTPNWRLRSEGIASSGNDVSVFVADRATLASKYPSDCRFILTMYSDAEKAEAVVWKSEQFSQENGAVYSVSLGGPVPVTKPSELFIVDISALVRDGGNASPYAGILFRSIPKHEGSPMPVFLKAMNQHLNWTTPHVIVLRDTPPETL